MQFVGFGEHLGNRGRQGWKVEWLLERPVGAEHTRHFEIAEFSECVGQRVAKKIVVFDEEDGGHVYLGLGGWMQQLVHGTEQLGGSEGLAEKRVRH